MLAQNQINTIAELNDFSRRHWYDPRHCQTMLTQGVRALLSVAGDNLQALMTKVATFNRFTEDNDPYNEHDFGSFEWQGEKLFWKFDYYDKAFEYGSEDPANPAITKRVLTIMLTGEY
jgi:hypothetical protein